MTGFQTPGKGLSWHQNKELENMSYVPVFAITGFMWLWCSKLDNQTISLLWLSAPRAAAMFVSSLLTNSRRGWLMLYQYTSVTQARLVRTARHRFHKLKMQQCSWLNFHKISNVDFLHKLDPETNRKKKCCTVQVHCLFHSHPESLWCFFAWGPL